MDSCFSPDLPVHLRFYNIEVSLTLSSLQHLLKDIKSHLYHSDWIICHYFYKVNYTTNFLPKKRGVHDTQYLLFIDKILATCSCIVTKWTVRD